MSKDFMNEKKEHHCECGEEKKDHVDHFGKEKERYEDMLTNPSRYPKQADRERRDGPGGN